MRYKTQKKQKKRPLIRYRGVERFLWLPLKLSDEWRWLEKAKIGQSYYGTGWVDEEWLN